MKTQSITVSRIRGIDYLVNNKPVKAYYNVIKPDNILDAAETKALKRFMELSNTVKISSSIFPS